MDRGIRSGISEIYRSDPETELRGGDSAEAKKMTKMKPIWTECLKI